MTKKKTQNNEPKKDKNKTINSCCKYAQDIIISWDLWVAIGLTLAIALLLSQSFLEITDILETTLNISLVIFIGIASITIIGYTLFFAIPKDTEYMEVVVSEDVYDFFLFVPFWIITCCALGLVLNIVCQIFITSKMVIAHISQIIPFDIHYLGLVLFAILLFLLLYVIFAFIQFCWILASQRIIQIEEEMLDEEDEVEYEIES